MARRVAVVLFNLGGPDTQEAVRPFLYFVRQDRVGFIDNAVDAAWRPHYGPAPSRCLKHFRGFYF